MQHLYPHLHPWKSLRPWERHSFVLLIAGLVYIAIGVSFYTTEITAANERALHVALSWWGMDVWGIIFMFAGWLAVISSRWPAISTTWGYVVLTGLSATWATFYGVGVLFDLAPVSNLRGSFIWGLLAFVWWGVSGLVNPPRVEAIESKTV
jgi:hypothetical protein